VPVVIEDATAFTLFGTVVTGEQVGVEQAREPIKVCEPPTEWPAARRIGLPLV
jgi:hypothetical protein